MQLPILFVCCWVLIIISIGEAQESIEIDVEGDIPDDGTWDLDCRKGYQELSTDFHCDEWYGGEIDIPPENLNGERGFWTLCDVRCAIKYNIQPGDISFKGRVYQRGDGFETEVTIDGVTTYVEGEGWIEFERSLVNGREISVRLDHFSPELFIALDKIVLTRGGPTQQPTETSEVVTSDAPGSTTEDDSTYPTSDHTTTLSSATTDPSGTVSDYPTNPSSSTDDSPTDTDSSITSTDSTTEITEMTSEDATNSPTSPTSGSTATTGMTSSPRSVETTTFSSTKDNRPQKMTIFTLSSLLLLTSCYFQR